MRDIRAILAAAALFVATGAIGTAQADDDHNSTTLYTPAALGARLSCNAVNVSRKTLTITISIIDGTGTEPMVLGTATLKTDPGLEFANDFGALTNPPPFPEGYCKFQVSGTDNPDDVRAVLITTTIAKQTTADHTTFPYILTRVLEAH